jgi:hypothetical protein
MFLYLSFVSLLLFVFQTFFYFERIVSLAPYHFSLSDISQIGTLFSFDTIPLFLLGYVFTSLVLNAVLKGKKEDDPYAAEHANMKQKLRSVLHAKRKFMIGVSILVYAGFCYLFASRMKKLTWLEPLDIVLFCFFFVSFVGFYWSGAFQLSRYEIIFEHYFKSSERKIADFAISNSALIEEMDKELGRTPKRENDKPSKPKAPYLCKSCNTNDATTYFCPNCNSLYCNVCALHNNLKCPSCNLELRRQQPSLQ